MNESGRDTHSMANPEEWAEELEQIQLRFMEEWRAGAGPTIEQYVEEYPDFAEELLDFILSFVEMEAALERTPELTTPSPTAQRARERALAGPCGLALSLAEIRTRNGWTLGKLARDLDMPYPLLSWLEQGDLSDWPDRVEHEVGQILGRPESQIHRMLQIPAPQQTATHFHADRPPARAPRKVRTWRQALEECQRIGRLTSSQRQKWWVFEEE